MSSIKSLKVNGNARSGGRGNRNVVKGDGRSDQNRHLQKNRSIDGLTSDIDLLVKNEGLVWQFDGYDQERCVMV